MKQRKSVKLKPRQTFQQRLDQLDVNIDAVNHRYFIGRFQDEMAEIEESAEWYHYICYLLLFTGCGAIYLQLLTNNLLLSLVAGALSSFFAIHYFVTLVKKQQFRLKTLTELNHYAATVVFNLEAGENPYQALEATIPYLREPVRSDIEQIVIKLNETTELETAHLRRYRFAPLDIFHQTLRIKREQGGNAKLMFESVLNNMYFQLIKYDEFSKRKKYVRKQVFTILAIATCIPLIVRYAAPNEFLLFQNHMLGQVMAVIVYILFFILASKTQAETLQLDLI
ncbi:MAG: type II secretion system F family protein [Culicoidibacterales bacterium]